MRPRKQVRNRANIKLAAWLISRAHLSGFSASASAASGSSRIGRLSLLLRKIPSRHRRRCEQQSGRLPLLWKEPGDDYVARSQFMSWVRCHHKTIRMSSVTWARTSSMCAPIARALSPHKSRYRPSSRDAATTGGNAGPKDNPPDVTRFGSATAKRLNALPR